MESGSSMLAQFATIFVCLLVIKELFAINAEELSVSCLKVIVVVNVFGVSIHPRHIIQSINEIFCSVVI